MKHHHHHRSFDSFNIETFLFKNKTLCSMYFFNVSTFEILPDEMILEICRYLHCSHVLYSFFNLNSRLNRTITSYCQHVWFRRASYKQLLYIYEQILPQIGSIVLSLTIHPLHQASFPKYFQDKLSSIFSNLKILTLTSWTSEYLYESMMNNLGDLIHLEKLVIQELTCSIQLPDWKLFEKICFLKNQFLTNLVFDYDCDSFNFKSLLSQTIISNQFQSLVIQLETLTDLISLLNCLPTIVNLDVSIKNSSLKSDLIFPKLFYLKTFSIWTIHYYSQFDDIIPLISFAPSIEQLSLTISTRDYNLIDGMKCHLLLPKQLKQFHYTVCYYSYENFDRNLIQLIKTSWQLIPIRIAFNENDKRIFLHTLPYSSSRLIIRSSLAKNMPIDDHRNEIYSKIDQIQVYMLNQISDVFPILKQCYRVRELTLLTTNEPLIRTVNEQNKQLIQLSTLNRLDILTIEGIPSDLDHLKELLYAAPNLSVLVIDFDCLLNLLENEDQPLITYIYLHRRILDLCIRIQESTRTQTIQKPILTIENMSLISRIFSRVRNLTIDYEVSEDDIPIHLIRTVINQFEDLVIFHIYGQIPKELLDIDIRQWIFQQNIFRLKTNDIFRIECTSTYFKIWL